LKLIGCLLLVSGWLIVLAALVMLTAFKERLFFAGAGCGIEILGLVLLTQGYKSLQRERE